jgi:hypothetical protein
MATTNPAANGHVELRLAAKDPTITQSGSSDRFTVEFTMEGVDLLELENVLRPRLAAVGVQRISRFGMTISLHGVEEGREGEVFHELQMAIDDVNGGRQAAQDDRDRHRSDTEAEESASEGRRERVRDAFRTAQGLVSPKKRGGA